jgi:hypothetical protein
MRLVFGTPQCDGFFMWGWWKTELWSEANAAAFYDEKWNPTPAYDAWKKLIAEWTTDEQPTVGEGGAVHFTGFFGDYEVLVDGKPVGAFTLENGKTDYSLEIR